MGNALRAPRYIYIKDIDESKTDVFVASHHDTTTESDQPLPSPANVVTEQSCIVCYELDVPFPSTTPTTACRHPVNVCASCLEQHVCSQISEGRIRIRCPALECSSRGRFMRPDEVLQTKVNEERQATYERFHDLKVRQTLNTERNMFWCRAPGCSSGQIHVEGAACPVVICQACTAQSCFKHDMIWHEGMTCKEFDRALQQTHPERAKQIKASGKWLKKNAKTCPNKGCGRWIEKIEGCDHMTCKSLEGGCGHEL
ncbi:RING finger protein [Ceratobasidium sp. AG-Ba]|nr:RING finger protein [Ceratobasidium sp. AG-Ba]